MSLDIPSGNSCSCPSTGDEPHCGQICMEMGDQMGMHQYVLAQGQLALSCSQAMANFRPFSGHQAMWERHKLEIMSSNRLLIQQKKLSCLFRVLSDF